MHSKPTLNPGLLHLKSLNLITSARNLFPNMITLTGTSFRVCVCFEATIQPPIYVSTDWFKFRRRIQQKCILSPCLLNFYAKYIMWSTSLDDSQAGIKIIGRSINNLRYAIDTTLMAESEEELKNLLMRTKEESE